jgi:hypothetical protein
METLTQLVAECMARHGFPSAWPYEPLPRIEFARSLLLPDTLPAEEALTVSSDATPTPLPSGF